jgi:hypothetical protein
MATDTHDRRIGDDHPPTVPFVIPGRIERVGCSALMNMPSGGSSHRAAIT